MIKLLIFDLDGVLVDTRPLHYISLNMALEECGIIPISLNEHISRYDGNTTKTKLKMLSDEGKIPIEKHNEIWKLKQKKTIELLEDIEKNERIMNIMKNLKNNNYIIYVASNSIYSTLKKTLMKLNILEFIDFIISNEDVKYPKPSPEIYFKCMERANVSVNETLIFEDSFIGRTSAISSGAYLCPIDDPNDLTEEKINNYICFYNNPTKNIKWKNAINIVIPMAGKGSRFQSEGYKLPKPLISINGKPMIQIVVENLNIDGNYIFIVQKDHYDNYLLNYILNLISPKCKIIITENITEGSACSVLLAEQYINNDIPLLIANSDQFVEWNSNEFLYSALNSDGTILTFKAENDNKWSYAKTDNDGFVSEVKEKEPISNNATVGIYYWKKGSDYVKYAKQMINKNIRVNNEFYTCPVYNEAISDGKKIKIKECKKMLGLGTPTDLTYFLNNYFI